jgi:phosphoserine phosphatase RsbU/P
LAADKFVTLFYGVLDAGLRTFRYTNAGHLPPLLVRGDGTHDKLAAGGAVLGVFRDWSYDQGLVDLAPGDRLCLFTDGITEAMRADGEEVGETGILRTVRAAGALSPNELRTHLLAEVNHFCNSQLHDDATLLLVSAMMTGRERNTPRDVTERETALPRTR